MTDAPASTVQGTSSGAAAPPEGVEAATDPDAAAGPWATFIQRGKQRLLQPVDIASIAYFRIALGLVLVWEVWRYFENDWIARYYIEPLFHFTYYGFGWVQPMPAAMMYAFFAGMLVLAAAFTVGYRYRIVAPLAFVGVAYWYLLDAARYLNHVYLLILLSFAMIFVPAHHVLSMDVAAGRVQRSDWAPTWSLWLLRFQLGVVYVFGGIAKISSDWLRGMPLADWLAARDDFPIIGSLFHEEWMVRGFAVGGLLLDLFIVPALLWRRTRWPAFAALVFFHASNDILWNIGVFPWLAIHASLIYFPPDWPRRLLSKLGVEAKPRTPTMRMPAPRKAIAVVLACLIAFNVFMPLRHHLYEGEADWTDEGHRYSWRMKLRDKDANATFWLTDPATNETWVAYPAHELFGWQISTMKTRPDMIHEYAIHLAEEAEQERGRDIEVRARVNASLHGRPEQWLIDPTVDIGNIPRGLAHRDWIVPLQHPMPDPFDKDRG